jgi:hypothetical protein
MFWVTALCNSPQDFLNELAHWSAHSRIPNLLTGDKATIDGLPERLADEVPFDRTRFDQIKNCPQRASELEALSGLYVTLG